MVIAPIRIFFLKLESIKNIQKGKMITIFMSKSTLSSISLVLTIFWSQEDDWHIKASYDRSSFIDALQLLSLKKHFRHLWI